MLSRTLDDSIRPFPNRASQGGAPESDDARLSATVAHALGSPDWYQALSLEERSVSPAPDAEHFDGALASRRLERWRSQSPFDQDPMWRARLHSAEISEAQLLALLGEPPGALAARLAPSINGEPQRPPSMAWLDTLREAYGDPDYLQPFPWSANANVDRCPFSPLIEPLLWHARAALGADARRLAKHYPAAPFEAETAARLLDSHLPDLLSSMLHRPMVVELHIAGMEERLEGDTPEQRFDDFVGQLREPERALEILARFPVLARQLVLRIDQWRAGALELLEHLAVDEEALRCRFNGGTPLGVLEAAAGAISDPHRGGRGVFLLGFDSGFRVAYKPKSMAVEVAFQDLLSWCSENGFDLGFRTLEILDGGDHGYMEMVDAERCAERAELDRFYRRQGAFLAVFYLLDGTDFHQENVIAAGEQPVPIDLETLFQPWINGRQLHDLDQEPGSSLRSTVMRANLLPEQWWGDRDSAGVDLSGLAAKEGQMTPKPVLAMIDKGTDSMRVERRRIEIPISESLPRLKPFTADEGAEDSSEGASESVSPLDFVQALEQGFTELYDLLLEHREALLAEGSPLDAFAKAEVRLLFRTTASYGLLQLESFHPHLLQNTLDRQRHFDYLWSGLERRPFLAQLIDAELRDLMAGDVPLFLTRGESRDVWSWDGERYPGMLEASGLERVRQRLGRLSADDRARQLSLISDSMLALRLRGEAVARPSYTCELRAEPIGADELLAEAVRIGDRVLQRCFQTRKEALWMTIDYQTPGGWQLVPTGPDVYKGLPGIAFFLGYLGLLSGERRFTQCARLALDASASQIKIQPSLIESVGAFSGWGGPIYVLTHLGALWQDSALLDRAEALAKRLHDATFFPATSAESKSENEDEAKFRATANIHDDRMLDLVAGSAGCMISLLTLHDLRPSAWLLRLAVACGDHLVATAEPQAGQDGVGWRMPLAGDRALAGLSHGAAGIAMALLRLWRVTDDASYLKTAVAGIRFERSVYHRGEGNWPDLRAGAAEPGIDPLEGHFMTAWCHGAPGIGLARLATLELYADDDVRREIDLAERATRAKGFGDNHCLCHGDLGNLELLYESALERQDDVAMREVYRRAGGIVDSFERHGWLFGLPGSAETPGLMTGLAGVGYGLARLAAPDRLPSILTLGPVPKE